MGYLQYDVAPGGGHHSGRRTAAAAMVGVYFFTELRLASPRDIYLLGGNSVQKKVAFGTIVTEHAPEPENEEIKWSMQYQKWDFPFPVK